MEYKGYMIYACVTQTERWTLDDSGELDECEGECSWHASDYSIGYDIVSRDGLSIGSALSIEGAKLQIDRLARNNAAQTAVRS